VEPKNNLVFQGYKALCDASDACAYVENQLIIPSNKWMMSHDTTTRPHD